MIKKNKSKHSNEIGKKSVLRQIWQNKMAYLLLSPLIDWNVTGSATFIGLDNFKELFSDPVFLNSVPTLLKLMLPRLLISVVVPLIMAELIFSVKNKKWQYNYRVMVLLPMVAPGMVYTLLWQKIYDPQLGLLTTILRGLSTGWEM